MQQRKTQRSCRSRRFQSDRSLRCPWGSQSPPSSTCSCPPSSPPTSLRRKHRCAWRCCQMQQRKTQRSCRSRWFQSVRSLRCPWWPQCHYRRSTCSCPPSRRTRHPRRRTWPRPRRQRRRSRQWQRRSHRRRTSGCRRWCRSQSRSQ